jgi:phosphoribosyl-AMP cyclohydrolase
MSSAQPEIESGLRFLPAFARSEVLPCVTVDADSKEILMVAYMNREALEMTIRTRKATYFSRSRNKLWIKGEESGNTQEVVDLLVDCDQDCIQLRVRLGEKSAACHMGYRSCFYRRLKPGSETELEFSGGERLFDPAKVYGQRTNKMKKSG